MTQVSTNEITSAVRSLLRNDATSKRHGVIPICRLNEITEGLSFLERALPSRDPSAFETANLDAFGYATVLGYLNDKDPLSLMDLADPVRDTIAIGRLATAMCLKKGLKVVRVPACEHVRQRYAKVTHVNAYPEAVLAKIICDRVQ